MARNFRDSDYAKNKKNKNIVYQSSLGIYEITEEDFLKSNPSLNHDDFLYWKNWSDEDYHKTDIIENREQRRVISIHKIEETDFIASISTEEKYMNELEINEKYKHQIANKIWNFLTETQKRRFYLYAVEGKSTFEIAKMEDKNQKTIYESIKGTERKIKKLYKKFQFEEKHPP